MSNVKRPEGPGTSNALPGIISALVVLVVLGLVVVLLVSRSGQSTAGTAADGAAFAPTPAALDTLATPVVEPAPTAAPAPAAPASAGEVGPQPATRTYDAPPPMTIDPARSYTATIATPRGDIVVQLRPDLAPQTVNNFVFLAREGFYNGLTWHRVIEGFMAQGGDPLGDGTGDAGYNVPAEFTNQVAFDRPGLLAMARSSDPDSASSQFFITTGAAPWLDGQYTIFGEVLAGQEIVNGIPLRDPATATTPGEQILNVTITEG